MGGAGKHPHAGAGPELVLMPRRRELRLARAFIIILAMSTLWMGRKGDPLFLLVAAFWGTGALLLGAYIRSRAFAVTLNSQELTLHGIRDAKSIPWSDFEFFDVVEHRGRRWVAFRWSSAYQGFRAPACLVDMLAPGYDGVLPDSYGKQPEQLATLLNRYKESRVRA